jgi:diadenosine tetraphosphate (Ap4A) HIT family hydrolase
MYCFFCHEAKMGCLPEDIDAGIPSRILRETENFLVIVDISPLTKGHLLIVPKAHYLSFGALPCKYRIECDELIFETIRTVSSVYNSPVIMEHGSSSCDDGAACIAHAHLQVIPCVFDLTSEISVFNPREIPDYWQLSEIAKQDKPYLFLRTQTGKMLVTKDIASIEKQFIRKVIGVGMNIQGREWDWRLNKRLDIFRETYYELSAIWKVK